MFTAVQERIHEMPHTEFLSYFMQNVSNILLVKQNYA